MYRKLYYGPTKPIRNPKDKDIRKNAPWTDDYIMENGNRLLIRKYHSESKIKISGLNDFSKDGFDIKPGDILYFFENKLHRVNGPAFFRKDELYIWLQNGIIHRDGDEPAFETDDDSWSMWFKNGVKHRESGPAVLTRTQKQFWLNGKHLSSEEEFINDIRNNRLKDILGVIHCFQSIKK